MHSAGGEPLARFLKNKKIDAEEVRMLDCLYNWAGVNWAQLTADSMQNSPGNDLEVVVVTADDPKIIGNAQNIRSVGGNHVSIIPATKIPHWDKHHSTVVGYLR